MDPGTRILFKHRLEARKLEISDPPSAGPLLGEPQILYNGGSVANGDSIHALVTPEEAVYLYLGYCDKHAFALFPPSGHSIRAEAGRETRIPQERGFDISGDSTSEVLYLIVSKSELSLASPELAVKIASSSGSIAGDCAGPMIDSSGSPIPPGQPIDVRLSDSAIEVVRYEFKHQASPVAR